MPTAADIAVVTQDPWLGGGAAAHPAAFLDAAEALGRRPLAYYVSRVHALTPFHPLAWRDGPAPSERFAPYRGFVPELEPLTHLAGLRMSASLRRARSLWVVATSAHFGLPALASRRPYACWIGTSLAAEWQARRAGGLPASRRLALAVNAPALRRIERAVLRGAVRVYATSPASRHAVAAAGRLDPEAVGVLPLVVDTHRFAPEPDEAWLARLAEPVIAFVGRADDPRKNISLLLTAFARLRRRIPAARLRLIGRPPRGPLPAGVEAVVSPRSVANLLRASTLFVLPSFQEGFGIVVAEALAAGVPSVVTPSGGPEELVARSRGGVVLSGFGEAELAATLATLLTDADRLLELRGRGRAYVEREHSPARLRGLLASALTDLEAA